MIDRRGATIVLGTLVGLGLVGTLLVTGAVTDDGAGSEPSVPSSEVLDAEPRTYDMTAGMCAIDLRVDVGDSERVVIQNELAGGSDRTVENTGERILSTVVPSDSEVLIYAVDLEENTSAVLERFHVTEDCSLTEVEK